jgi:hypothetical protein
MADTGSLGVRAELSKVLSDEHADLLREGVALVLREVMELEVGRLAGAERYERSDERASYRNGYRPRRFDTRVGTIALEIPKLRSGPSYLPSFLEARTRSEQALLLVVMEAYVNGVSTRKVERLVEQLGVQGISKSAVSRIVAGLDERAEAFRNRPLEGAYPYLWLDARIERVREHDAHTVRHKALLVAYGVHQTGRREVIGTPSERSSQRPPGASSCAPSSPAACRACPWWSPTPTRGSRRPSPASSAPSGSAARSTLCATCLATCRARATRRCAAPSSRFLPPWIASRPARSPRA